LVLSRHGRQRSARSRLGLAAQHGSAAVPRRVFGGQARVRVRSRGLLLLRAMLTAPGCGHLDRPRDALSMSGLDRTSHVGAGLRELRDRNRRRVILALKSRHGSSQADISRLTSLSRTTVSTIVRDLIQEGVVEECNRLQSRQQGGRPGVGLRLRASQPDGWVRSFRHSMSVALLKLQGWGMTRTRARDVITRIWRLTHDQ